MRRGKEIAPCNPAEPGAYATETTIGRLLLRIPHRHRRRETCTVDGNGRASCTIPLTETNRAMATLEHRTAASNCGLHHRLQRRCRRVPLCLCACRNTTTTSTIVARHPKLWGGPNNRCGPSCQRKDNGSKIAYDIQSFGNEKRKTIVCVCVVGVVWVLCVLLVLCVVS